MAEPLKFELINGEGSVVIKYNNALSLGDWSYDGVTWEEAASATVDGAHPYVYYKSNDNTFPSGYLRMVTSGSGYLKISGDVMALYPDNISSYEYVRGIFSNSLNIKDVSEMVFAEPEHSFQYLEMFNGCYYLEDASFTIPKSNGVMYAFQRMLEYTLRLKKPPIFPADMGTGRCSYADMFAYSGLETPPELPATRVNDYSYLRMFKGCTSLTSIPELPATQIGTEAYEEMFSGCTSLDIVDTEDVMHTKAFTIPSEGTTSATPSSAAPDMFLNIGSVSTIPATPEFGKVYYMYGIADGVYHWTGSEWKLDANVGTKGFKIYYQETEPTDAEENSLWAWKN